MKQKILLLLLLIASFLLIACSSAPLIQGSGNLETHEHVNLDAFSLQDISPEEESGLIQMREEEKLARDVYITLYELWDIKTFSNIAQSEATHTLEVKDLLDRYGISDPVTDDTVGVFTSNEIQNLYNDLVEQGSASSLDALRVGALIEDLDIKDLNDLISQTDNEDIKYVYGNLKAGSENHMRSFTKQITNNGGTYLPTYISQETYDLIISQDHTGSGLKNDGIHQ